jgi:hypothetical protein
MIALRIGSALASACLAAAATLAVAAPAHAETVGCALQSTVDFAPNLSMTTSVKHVIGSGTLTGCAGGVDATFRLNGDGPANCLGHSFKLYLDIFWANGDYSFVELSGAALLQIGVHVGEVLDYAYKGSNVGIVSVPDVGFLLNCLRPGGVHTVNFVGAFGLS